ncbi:trypsin-like peptidase domain-containing protein [Loktanella sp. SALINAS62]|uniref:trypsin-like peptidase domain-containing protein n=1 Tax=Loktanella sp. SALINAS62 TaxID=2706124 RepID=UPI001B8AE059|nr:trypsin-like peptidase domain-containing protein [Loktanella sp. SALINAS62]MBS1302999.1 peptidoglycan-binding protein [Loktanella sp. SALINAS62]
MFRCSVTAVFGAALATTALPALAQDALWIQLEAQPSIDAAMTRAQRYDAGQDNVAAFNLGGRWNAVVIGPFDSRTQANDVLRDLRRSGIAPTDAFLTDGARFASQFYPEPGATAAVPAPQDAPSDAAPAAVVIDTPAIQPDETVQEARVSEQSLSQSDKEALQIALNWAGFYDAAIDGAFGRGTRSAMEAWQLANGYAPTGVLTTAQRSALIGAYNAVLDGMNLQLVRDNAAGIEMKIPTGVVSFVEYEPPFARYGPKSDDLNAQVLMISQQGDQNRLFGLYEILQTLAIVPMDGERQRGDTSFEINATGAKVETYVTARLDDGQIKGFALVWPADDTARFTRIRDEMRDSFTAVDGVLDPALARTEDQAIDLVAGLAVRKPSQSQAGFYITNDGTVLTAAAALDNCEEITLNGAEPATMLTRDADLNLAVLQPTKNLSPQSVAQFQTQVPRLQSEIAVAGYPFGGVLSAPTLTFGRLSDIRGLNGEEDIKRLTITTRPGDTGGPVFDNSGAVLGMLLPRATGTGQVLPADVSFLVDAETIKVFLDRAGITAQTTDTLTFMAPETLTSLAAENTVLVSCW